jgi:hypothetical protein
VREREKRVASGLLGALRAEEVRRARKKKKEGEGREKEKRGRRAIWAGLRGEGERFSFSKYFQTFEIKLFSNCKHFKPFSKFSKHFKNF